MTIDVEDTKAVGGPSQSTSFAAVRVCWLEVQDAPEASVDFAYEGWREMPCLGVQVGLVQGDQGGHVDNRVFGQARQGGWKEDVPGHGGQAGVGSNDGSQGGVEPTGVERVGLNDQDRAALGRPAATRFT